MASHLHKTEIKPKPWGSEIWFAHTEKYAGKILEIKKGHRYSLQYHEKKHETQYIFSGKAKFTYGTDKAHLQEKILNQGDKIDIHPYTIHRLEALQDTLVFEVSTPELKDVIKLADDYGRSGKGNNPKLDKRLAANKSLNKSIKTNLTKKK
jgi:mannose-6-phosphate isomerase-like protein (cupin superfamily)